jgi:Ca2+-binding RTX toxin-like protein
MRKTLLLIPVVALALTVPTPSRGTGRDLSDEDLTGGAVASRPACTIRGTSGNDDLRGTRGDDVICAGPGDDEVFGAAGNDLMYLGAGNDVFRGGRGNDTIYGGRGPDSGQGGPGDDRMFGGPHADSTIWDWAGDDLVAGGRGNDVCLDLLDGRSGDQIRGGPGRDLYEADPGDEVRSAEIDHSGLEGC